MKISAQEEYGIRCLLALGRCGPGASATIAEISRSEGLSKEYVAKLMRILRRGGLVRSVRGQAGGYVLARPLEKISVAEALAVLGGRLWDPNFCEQHPGVRKICSHSRGCTVRTLWRRLQDAVDEVLGALTLKELLEEPRPSSAPPPRSFVGLPIF